MKSESRHYESQLINELIREVSEVGKHVRGRQHLIYAFNPYGKTEKEAYHHNMKLIAVIHDILNECCINIKSRGYTYIKDAVCIITDHGTLEEIDIVITDSKAPKQTLKALEQAGVRVIIAADAEEKV